MTQSYDSSYLKRVLIYLVSTASADPIGLMFRADSMYNDR